jgi:hypothetical protein
MTRFFVFSAIILFFTVSEASAQSKFTVGASGGVINPWMTNQNNYGLDFEMDYAPKVGGNGQIVLGYQFNKHVGVEAGIGYALLGQKYKDTHNGNDYQRNVSLGYLQIPLLFKFRSGGEFARFCGAVGPQFNFLMSAKQTYTKNGVTYDSVLYTINHKEFKVGDEEIKDRYESMDIMVRLDLGVEFSLTDNLLLNFGMTSAYGLMDVNAADYRLPDHSSGEYHASHNLYGGFNAGIHYAIPLGK